MKTCLCCGTQSYAGAITCLVCGEGSWSDARIVVIEPEPEREKPIVIESSKSVDAIPTVPEDVAQPIAIADPDTAVEVPRVRRSKRPN